jgi:hypothetical protein
MHSQKWKRTTERLKAQGVKCSGLSHKGDSVIPLDEAIEKVFRRADGKLSRRFMCKTCYEGRMESIRARLGK